MKKRTSTCSAESGGSLWPHEPTGSAPCASASAIQTAGTSLEKAWPGVAQHADVRQFDGRPYAGAFLLTGGVPCQPASRAGKQGGRADDRWLWGEAVRVLAEVRPAWAVFENPAGIADVGLDGILADVGRCGYEVGLADIPACAVGAPHGRARFWIICRRSGVADADEPGRQRTDAASGADGLCAEHRQGELADAAKSDRTKQGYDSLGCGRVPESGVADAGRLDGGEDEPERGTGEGSVAHAGHDARCAKHEEQLQGRDSGDGKSTGERMVHATGGGQRERGSARGNSGHADERSEGGGMGDAELHGCDGAKIARSLGKGEAEGRMRECERSAWSRFVWLPCADGKVRRAPDDAFLVADGLSAELLARQVEETHHSILAAFGNSIVWQVAAEVIAEIVQAERDE